MICSNSSASRSGSLRSSNNNWHSLLSSFPRASAPPSASAAEMRDSSRFWTICLRRPGLELRLYGNNFEGEFADGSRKDGFLQLKANQTVEQGFVLCGKGQFPLVLPLFFFFFPVLNLPYFEFNRKPQFMGRQRSGDQL